ncbi:hypothetical protein BDQ17DRAFT_1378900 [Cyathus striatus]|nr:hypothetical protein BDQ17DRAFT_1378900 [Cyathus striatus]
MMMALYTVMMSLLCSCARLPEVWNRCVQWWLALFAFFDNLELEAGILHHKQEMLAESNETYPYTRTLCNKLYTIAAHQLQPCSMVYTSPGPR